MMTWNDYKAHIKKTDPAVKKELEQAEEDAVAYEIKQGINQAILYEQGKIEADVTVLRNEKEDAWYL